MTSSPRILIGTIATVLIIGLGLSAGFYFQHPKSEHSKNATVDQKPEPNFNTYDISPPSRGEVLFTHDFPVAKPGLIFETEISKSDGADIRTGQKVLFEDQTGTLLGARGKITEVRTNTTNSNLTVKIDIKADESFKPDSISTAKIITRKIPDALRLPHSALIKKKNEETYVWEARLNEDGTRSVELVPIRVIQTTPDFFAMEERQGQENIFILNPDKNLQNGQKINVKEVLFQGPPLSMEDSAHMLGRIQARARLSSLRMEESKGRNAKAKCLVAAGQNGTSIVDDIRTEGANQIAGKPATNAARDFMDKVQQLTPAVSP